MFPKKNGERERKKERNIKEQNHHLLVPAVTSSECLKKEKQLV
jgi:hypothetical protein